MQVIGLGEFEECFVEMRGIVHGVGIFRSPMLDSDYVEKVGQISISPVCASQSRDFAETPDLS